MFRCMFIFIFIYMCVIYVFVIFLDFSVREVVQHYGSRLPILAKVQAGYAGEVGLQYTMYILIYNHVFVVFPDFSVREVVQHYGSRLPILAKVQAGYAGEVGLQYTMGQVCFNIQFPMHTEIWLTFQKALKGPHSPKLIPIEIGIPIWLPNLGWNSKLKTDSNWNSKLNSWSVGRVHRSTHCDPFFFSGAIFNPFWS